MFTKDEMKRKYAAEFDRKKNYQKIIKPKKKRTAAFVLGFACAACFCMLNVELLMPKKDVFVSKDSIAQELGPQIELNVNLPEDAELKSYSAANDNLPASALRADMEVRSKQTDNISQVLKSLCPEGFVFSENTEFAIMEKETEEEINAYEYIEYTNDSQSIRLAYSTSDWPFRCTYLSPNEEISVLNGVEMRISYSPQLRMYLCLFQMNDIYFDVEASELSETELIEFLLNLIDKAGELK